MSDLELEVKDGKFFAIISYLSFLCILSLVLKKDNKFVLFHAKQGLVIFVAEVALFLISIIPFMGWIVNMIGMVVCLVLSVLGILNVLQGNCTRLPGIADIADKIIL